MSSLFDFEEKDALELILVRPVNHPTGGGLIGWFAHWNGPGNAYLSPRTKEEHFFRKHEGYAISESILEREIQGNDIETVFIAEDDTATMYEYDASDFYGAILLDYDDYDRQRCVPIADARRTWDAEDVHIAK
ncbi:hypothetical protein HSTV2_45 [Halorubrum sodomense tailed virus 2]|uniref:Uncharacterized protein n=1 Tax=Halorubrum sodomense tailed virus 2 TaxID=1262527 RepID=L7TGL4_9CAUD|nr:hypothetical protein HSTV2_45 [Halorubrum sodomense tailed virus 2]AGC34314.1 hypothetical protein HSTV2_45 [Halorubrum sodomense tailed virus 2]